MPLSGTDGHDHLIGTDGDDRICAMAGDDVVESGAGDDTVFAGAGSDHVQAGPGVDLVTGGAGNDSLFGDDGDDDLAGDDGHFLTGPIEDGDDVLDGGAGNDQLAGDGGADRLRGGGDADALSGGSGNDQLAGGTGTDSLLGDGDDDVITGDEGADEVHGGAGADRVTGGSGADRLTGGDGADVLAGGDDDDTVVGGLGADQLDGGTGADALDGGPSTDTIDGGTDTDSCVSSATSTDVQACEQSHVNTELDHTASYVTALAPDAGAVVAPVQDSEGLTAVSTAGTVTAPLKPQGVVRIRTADNEPDDGVALVLPDITIGLPETTGHGDAQVGKDGSVVYPDTGDLVDLTTQTTEDGSVRISTVIHSAAAPTRYSYPVTVAGGGSLHADPSGGVAVFASDGSYVGEVLPAWARDATGREIPTHYEVNGLTITQVVDISDPGIAFPVVADPTWGNCHSNYKMQQRKTIAEFKRRAQRGDGAYMHAGTSKLCCGWQNMKVGSDGEGYRHIYQRHSGNPGTMGGGTPWSKYIDSKHPQWRYVADEGMIGALKDPQRSSYRESRDTFCYSRKVYLWIFDSRGRATCTDKYYWAKVIVAENTGNIISAFPSGVSCL